MYPEKEVRGIYKFSDRLPILTPRGLPVYIERKFQDHGYLNRFTVELT